MIASLRVSPLSIALGYAIIASVWILFSDRIIEYGAGSVEALSLLQSVKGLVFVTVTAGLLYFFSSRMQSSIKSQEQQKEQQEKEFEKLFQSTPNPIWVYDSDSDSVLEVNQAAIQKYGYSRSEFLKLSKSDIFIRQLSDKLSLQKDAEEEDSSEIWEHQTKNGQKLKVKVNFETIKYAGKNADLIITADLTRREQTLQKLKIAYEQLHYHISNTPLGVIEWDEEFRVKFWSDRAAEIFGWQADEVMGLHPDEWKMVHEEDKERVSKTIESLIKGGDQGWQQSNRNYHKDGSIKYCNWFNSRIMDEEGENVISVLSLVEDFTEQQNYRERVNRYQQRFELAADLASDVIWEWDPHSNQIWFSDSVIDSFQRDDMVGYVDLSVWEKYVHEQSKQQVNNSLKEYAKHGQGVWEERYLFQKGNGEYAHVIDRGRMQFDSEGNPYRMVGTMIDETEHRLYEEKMQHWNRQLEAEVKERTQKLESVNEELEAFTYSVSHDLKAPVRSIDGFARALKTHLNDNLDSEAETYLNRVIQAGERMGSLINDLLKLSRVSRKEIKYQQVNVSEIAEEILNDLKNLEPERSIDFRCDEAIIVSGDDKLIRVMFENLLGNAWKFTKYRENAKIELQTLNDSDSDKHQIYLKDNGDGFDPNYANKLFRPFQRLHNKEEFEGTGIGLATVKRVAARHNATVSALGTKGKGAEFYISWPVN